MTRTLTHVRERGVLEKGRGRSSRLVASPVPRPSPTPVAGEPSKPPEPTTPSEPTPAEPAATDPAKVNTERLAETTAFEKAVPVFDKFYAKCHSKTGSRASQKKLAHFDMTTYPFSGHRAMEPGDEIRNSLGIGRGKPTMPFDKKGAVKGERARAGRGMGRRVRRLTQGRARTRVVATTRTATTRTERPNVLAPSREHRHPREP